MNDFTLLEELALLGLHRAGADGRRATELLADGLKKALGEEAKHLPETLRALAGRGLVEELPGKPRQKVGYWRLLPAGEGRLPELLGPLNLKGNTWRSKGGNLIVAKHALQLPARTAAALLKGGGLAAYFLAERLGEEFRPGVSAAALGLRVAAKALGASNVRPEALWQGLAKRAAGQSGPTEKQPAADFAVQVLEAARQADEGWFGEHKFFIHRAWEAWKRLTGGGLSLPAFKDQLLAALRGGHLDLARADFTEGMAADDVAQAETLDGDEVFHFIAIRRP